MAKRVALYARVSTDGQSVENQLRELEAVASKEGWEVVERFIDKGISGAKGREGRPAFDRLCKGIVRREFEMVAAWSVDVPTEREVVVYCVYGHEVSRVTALRLHAAGVRAKYLNGGFDAWAKAGRALEDKS